MCSFQLHCTQPRPSVQMAMGHSSFIIYHRYYPPTHISTLGISIIRLFCGCLQLAVYVPSCPFQAHSNKLTRGRWLTGERSYVACSLENDVCQHIFSQFSSVEFLEHTYIIFFISCVKFFFTGFYHSPCFKS